MEKLFRMAMNGVLFVAGVVAFALVLNLGLRASEKEDCLKLQAWKEKGHTVVPPEWCYEEGFLERQ